MYNDFEIAVSYILITAQIQHIIIPYCISFDVTYFLFSLIKLIAIAKIPIGIIYLTNPNIPPKKSLKAFPIYPDLKYIKTALKIAITNKITTAVSKLIFFFV